MTVQTVTEEQFRRLQDLLTRKTNEVTCKKQDDEKGDLEEFMYHGIRMQYRTDAFTDSEGQIKFPLPTPSCPFYMFISEKSQKGFLHEVVEQLFQEGSERSPDDYVVLESEAYSWKTYAKLMRFLSEQGAEIKRIELNYKGSPCYEAKIIVSKGMASEKAKSLFDILLEHSQNKVEQGAEQ